MNGGTIDNALSVERLEELRPPWDEHFDLTWRARCWYNEAPYTAAALFVEAAEESDTFRERFVSGETESVDVGGTSVEMEKWRSTMEKELPELHAKLNSIKLSAFQGGAAEQMARKALLE